MPTNCPSRWKQLLFPGNPGSRQLAANENPQFSYPGARTTGFTFNGEFIGQAVSPQIADQYYLEAAYVSDRECFDEGAEYGGIDFRSSGQGHRETSRPTFLFSITLYLLTAAVTTIAST